VRRGEPVPLPRALSRAGALTRTEAEGAIEGGRVRVNGRVALDARVRVDPVRDRIEVDGRPVGAAAGTVVVLLNKPRGLLVTRSDPEGRPTVFDLLPKDRGLLRCVGRLDGPSAGLLLATTDTALAAALESPDAGVPRVYRVKVRPRAEDGALARLMAGTPIDGVLARPDSVEVESHGPRSSWLRFTLREGRNREIRRLAAGAGLEVEHLVRVAFGPIVLGDLPPGEFRALDPREVSALRAASRKSAAPPSPGPSRPPTMRRPGG
jgi:23S rRNA pseudouridine2605 synthase